MTKGISNITGCNVVLEKFSVKQYINSFNSRIILIYSIFEILQSNFLIIEGKSKYLILPFTLETECTLLIDEQQKKAMNNFIPKN